MNHYERLKVSPDAPAEVIRAAYRALATKLHPDRQGGDAGPTEEAHEAMAALNASYLVLTNAKARVAYDAQLQTVPAVHSRPATGAFQAAAPDIEWLKDKQSRSGAAAVPIPNWAWALLFSALATAAAMGWVVWNESKRMSFDRSLTQVAGPATGRVVSGVVVAAPQVDVSALPSDLDPSVAEQIAQAAAEVNGVDASASAASAPVLNADEMDKLSNDELLARMSQIMDGQVSPALAGVATPAVAPPVKGIRKTAPPSFMLPWQQPAHHLDGGQALPLKLAPNTRMLSGHSNQH